VSCRRSAAASVFGQAGQTEHEGILLYILPGAPGGAAGAGLDFGIKIPPFPAEHSKNKKVK
jgi:hypothetical protein